MGHGTVAPSPVASRARAIEAVPRWRLKPRPARTWSLRPPRPRAIGRGGIPPGRTSHLCIVRRLAAGRRDLAPADPSPGRRRIAATARPRPAPDIAPARQGPGARAKVRKAPPGRAEQAGTGSGGAATVDAAGDFPLPRAVPQSFPEHGPVEVARADPCPHGAWSAYRRSVDPKLTRKGVLHQMGRARLRPARGTARRAWRAAGHPFRVLRA